jgi:hypothetical protein
MSKQAPDEHQADSVAWSNYLRGIVCQLVCLIGTFSPWIYDDNGLYEYRSEFVNSGVPAWTNLWFCVFSVVECLSLLSRTKMLTLLHGTLATGWYSCFVLILLFFWLEWGKLVQIGFYLTLGASCAALFFFVRCMLASVRAR